MSRLALLWKMLALGMIAALAGCTTTEAELRTGGAEHSTFHVNLPYALVLRNFQAGATKCFAGGTNGAYNTITEVESSPGSVGRISITEFGPFGMSRALLVADISAGNNGTEVEYFRHHIMIVDSAQPILAAWAAGLDKGCGLPFN